MKEAGLAHWQSPNYGAINSSGFAGLPGGYRYFNGTFYFIGDDGYWWSSTEVTPFAFYRNLNYNLGNIYRNYTNKQAGISVRCLRD